MKILLREHVDDLGDRGDIVTVAPGYARNYLLPKGLAFKATPGNMAVLAQQRKVWEAREAKEVGEAEALAARLGELQLSVTKKAGESGTLYGSVTNSEIAELLSSSGVEVDRRRILMHDPIKTVGEFEVQIKLHRQVTGRVKLQVHSEEVRSEEGTE